MSEVDQQPECTRQWRSLGRALIVAGATVAGTSAVWLAGAAASADTAADALPVEEPERAAVSHPNTFVPEQLVADTVHLLTTDSAAPPDSSAAPTAPATPAAPSTATTPAAPESAESPDRLDPAIFRLGDLDQPTLLTFPSQPHEDHAEAAPSGSSTAQLGDALRQIGELPPAPVRQLVTTATGHDTQLGRLTAARSGLDDLAAAPRHVATTAPDPSGAFPGVVDPPHVDDTPNLQPGPAVRAAPSHPAPSTGAGDRVEHESREHAHVRTADTAPRTATARPPGSSASAQSAATACTWSADWPGTTAVLQGRQFSAEQLSPAARAGAAHDPGAPAGGCEDQPGTTPD